MWVELEAGMDVYHLVGALLLEWPSQFCAWCECSKTVWRQVCVQLQISIVRNTNMQSPEYQVKMHMPGKTMEDVVVGRFCIHFYCENQMIEARMASAFHDSKCASHQFLTGHVGHDHASSFHVKHTWNIMKWYVLGIFIGSPRSVCQFVTPDMAIASNSRRVKSTKS